MQPQHEGLLEVKDGIEYRIFERRYKDKTKEAIIEVWGSHHPFYKHEPREVLEFIAEFCTEEGLRSRLLMSVIALDGERVIAFVIGADWATLKLMNPPSDPIFDRLRAYNKFEDELTTPFVKAHDLSVEGIWVAGLCAGVRKEYSNRNPPVLPHAMQTYVVLAGRQGYQWSIVIVESTTIQRFARLIDAVIGEKSVLSFEVDGKLPLEAMDPPIILLTRQCVEPNNRPSVPLRIETIKTKNSHPTNAHTSAKL